MHTQVQWQREVWVVYKRGVVNFVVWFRHVLLLLLHWVGFFGFLPSLSWSETRWMRCGFGYKIPRIPTFKIKNARQMRARRSFSSFFLESRELVISTLKIYSEYILMFHSRWPLLLKVVAPAHKTHHRTRIFFVGSIFKRKTKTTR
jgi:hypothetical protein